MAVEPRRYRFSREQYHQMGEAGVFRGGPRVELIDGEIVQMSPMGRRHKAGVDRLNDIFVPSLHGQAVVRIQSSIVLGEDGGEPEPDIAVLKYRADFYADSDETPDDILLLVEVAESSEPYDRQVKLPLYARHGIPEAWIASLNREQIEAHRDPRPDGYASTRVYRRGESLSPLAFPELTVAVDDIFGR